MVGVVDMGWGRVGFRGGGQGREGAFTSPLPRSSSFPFCRRRSFVPLTFDKSVLTPYYVASTVGKEETSKGL